MVSLKRVFERGMDCVAFIRIISLQGLHTIDFDEKKVFCNEEILSSLESMPKVNMENIMPLSIHVSTMHALMLTVIHHNIESLHCHFDHMRRHHEMCPGDVSQKPTCLELLSLRISVWIATTCTTTTEMCLIARFAQLQIF